ncbi:carboxymuconolactone decarboxylase family protein [Novosphingobium album (ex Hu et al. 2023)]|uniref:Carboxymuconolactone decarboxylase family protein n=1 Tax=Novosphingobium album (ex Hu et al. 2023) TaxID=2930093 RepID=A0ABT0B2T3_9SPHN|nr:carboxymuconolactone decarboxylase family protein [Novosphingobium album (ex Hu et al. 2023)]MCJ2179367.1 carboxymuconolactone decarboxylase family protein [Novosphingobium album (ex Hu et al. 2023)]
MDVDTAEFDPGFDIAAREAHVVGAGPRIEPVTQDNIDDASRELVHAVRAGAGAPRMDDVPEYMRTMLKHPDIFRCQMEMGTALFNGRIPPRERELAILRIGWLCRAPYEWGQHVEIAYRVGLDRQAVERTRTGSTAPGWTAHEAAILHGVEELLEDMALSDETWDTLAESWDEAQLIEFPMMVGQYVATAFVQNTLRVRLVDDNPGLTRL